MEYNKSDNVVFYTDDRGGSFLPEKDETHSHIIVGHIYLVTEKEGGYYIVKHAGGKISLHRDNFRAATDDEVRAEYDRISAIVKEAKDEFLASITQLVESTNNWLQSDNSHKASCNISDDLREKWLEAVRVKHNMYIKCSKIIEPKN